MRLFLCGITSNEEEKIKDLIDSTQGYFDGLVWCVDSNPNADSTYKLLDDNKKDGLIVKHRWHEAHDVQTNEWLMSGIIKEGDWCFIADSSEKPSQLFLDNLRSMTEEFADKDIQALYFSGRPFLFRWTPYLYCLFTPHWALLGFDGKIVSFPEEEKNKWIINKRDLNPTKHYQEHDTKYFLYGRSNQIDAFYGKYGQEIIHYHEKQRRWFRKHLIDLGYPTTLDGLARYFEKGLFSSEAIDIIESEFCLSEYFRRIILYEDFMKDIVPLREKWSFKNYLSNGNGFSDPNYLGTRLKYDKTVI